MTWQKYKSLLFLKRIHLYVLDEGEKERRGLGLRGAALSGGYALLSLSQIFLFFYFLLFAFTENE